MPPCPWLAKQRDDAVKQILGQRKDEALRISSRRKRHEMGEVRTIVFGSTSEPSFYIYTGNHTFWENSQRRQSNCLLFSLEGFQMGQGGLLLA